MKIIHIVDTMEIGGAEVLTAMLCRWQRDQGHQVSVGCLYKVGVLGEQLRGEEIRVSLLSSSGESAAYTIYRRLQELQPDVVHCHNATAAILSAAPARLARVGRILVTRHGCVDPPYNLWRELKFALASRCCNWVVAVCELARSNLSCAPFATKEKIVRIYNAVRGPVMSKGAKLPKSGFVLLHVARLNWTKDQQTLLRAFAQVKLHIPDAQLWIVGDGELRKALEDLAIEIGVRESVTFFGEQLDIAPFLASADLFVLSSVTEGIPISLLEALEAGLPAVVTRVGGMREVMRMTDAVVGVQPSDPNALASAIEDMANSRAELATLSANARLCYRQHFTLERMATEYMVLYNPEVSVQVPLRSS